MDSVLIELVLPSSKIVPYLLKGIYAVILFSLLVLSLRQGIKRGFANQYYLFVYLAYVVATELLGLYIGKFLRQDNNWIFNIYFLINLIYFAFFFFKTYQLALLKRIAIFLAFIFFCVYFLFVPDNFLSLKSGFAKGNLVALFGLIWLCLLYFLDVINSGKSMKLRHSFSFWVTLGIFIWSTMTSLRFVGVYFFSNDGNLFLNGMASFVDVINIITYSLYLIALLCLNPQKISN